MNIAILGAPGCVGQNLIKKLLETPEHEVIASYRTENEIPQDLQHKHLAWKQVNLLNPKRLPVMIMPRWLNSLCAPSACRKNAQKDNLKIYF